jgi:hypothetical protein
VELSAKFDSVMAEHFRRICDKDTHVHYLGNDIQNQLIQIISEAVKKSKAVPLHAMEAHGGRGGIAPTHS